MTAAIKSASVLTLIYSSDKAGADGAASSSLSEKFLTYPSTMKSSGLELCLPSSVISAMLSLAS